MIRKIHVVGLPRGEHRYLIRFTEQSDPELAALLLIDLLFEWVDDPELNFCEADICAIGVVLRHAMGREFA